MNNSVAKWLAPLLFFFAVTAHSDIALPLNAEKITAVEFEDLKKKAVNLKEISSQDGVLTVWNAGQCPQTESNCYDYPAYLLVRSGKTDPVHFKVPFKLYQNGGSNFDLVSPKKAPLQKIMSVKQGAYFFFLTITAWGARGGSYSSYPIFYDSPGKILKIGQGTILYWGSDINSAHEEYLKLQLKDLNGDGIKEIIINKTDHSSGCREGKCRRIEECPEQTPCPYSTTSEWVAGIWDFRGKDLMRYFGYGACWDYQSIDSQNPGPEFWSKVEPYRFTGKEFITWQPEKWQGPKDLSFEVKLAKDGKSADDNFGGSTYLDISVNDDVVIADPALPAIQRDHLEIWVAGYGYDNEKFQLGIIPPESGAGKAKIESWKNCDGPCLQKGPAKKAIDLEKISADWQNTPDGYRVMVKLPPEIYDLRICASDNDSLTEPEQKTMMCSSRYSSGLKQVANKDRCNASGD